MQISVLVPTHQSGRTIEACLRAIRASTHPICELLVVDNASQDETCALAGGLADFVIRNPENLGQARSRNIGIQAARGEVIVCIDSDVVIPTDAVARIADYLTRHEDVDAVTGLLSKKHPNLGYFSQYKNLYMHFVFRDLPKRVGFLYGSIHAFRTRAAVPYDPTIRGAVDTALGQELIRRGRRIDFLRDLEVVHLKRHDLRSFLRNDFAIPYGWVQIFIHFSGWRQLGRGGTGFAHSPIWQLASVALAPLVIGLVAASACAPKLAWMALLGLSAWLALNARFLSFLRRERGTRFSLLAIPVTFLDQLTMASGVAAGMAVEILSLLGRQRGASS